MNTYKNVILITVMILSAIAFYIAMVRVDRFIDLKNHELLNNAIDTCAQSARYIHEDTATGIRTEEPIQGTYITCMQEKGYK